MRKRWDEIKPVVKRVYDVIKADPNAKNLADAKQRAVSVTYRLENNFTPPQQAVLEPLRDEIISKASLTDDEQKQLIYWGVNVRKWLKVEWRYCADDTVNIPEAKATLENYISNAETNWKISFDSAIEIIEKSLRLIKEEHDG